MSYTTDDWHWYGTDGLQVVPYMPSTPVYNDRMLSYLYFETLKAGKIDLIFCGDTLNHDAFVNFFYTRKTMQVLCEVEGPDHNLKPIGYSWLDLPRGVDGARAAHCGFSFFGEAGKRPAARDLGMLGLAYWMIAMKVNVVHGILLDANLAGRNYASRLGFKTIAVVPNYHFYEGRLEPARVMSLTDEEFLPLFKEWREKNPVAVPE